MGLKRWGVGCLSFIYDSGKSMYRKEHEYLFTKQPAVIYSVIYEGVVWGAKFLADKSFNIDTYGNVYIFW